MSTEDAKEAPQPAEGSEQSSRPAGGPYSIVLAPDRLVLQEARRLVGDRNVRVEDLATCASQDPVTVLELLRHSNALFYAGGRQTIVSAKSAIVRLGSQIVLECIETLSNRPAIEDEDIRHWFELHRSRCKRTGIIARMLAEILAKNLADECQSAALLLNIGEMLAVVHLGPVYVKLAADLSRSGILYRLANEYKFDVETIGLSYLQRNGVPQGLLNAIDRNATSKSPDRTVMKPLIQAAAEIVDAFDSNRWDKLAPGRTLPPKSSLRFLQLQDTQYQRLYERASGYLHNARIEDDKRKRLASEVEEAPAATTDTEAASATEEPSPNTLPEEARPDYDDIFSLRGSTKHSSTPRVDSPRAIAVPTVHHSGASSTVVQIAEEVAGARTSEELLSSLLRLLVDVGPFHKSALIVVSRDRKHAIVVAARGPHIGNGQKITLDDPLSPLAQCFTKVQSFAHSSNRDSPFGSKSYAISPLDADHETPVALYADCGDYGTLTFEARRVFRTVVDIINQKLPSLPGGIPVELDS
jgi:HD-like signal output (HDOD) protein